LGAVEKGLGSQRIRLPEDEYEGGRMRHSQRVEGTQGAIAWQITVEEDDVRRMACGQTLQLGCSPRYPDQLEVRLPVEQAA
jgi:hypothetical protein